MNTDVHDLCAAQLVRMTVRDLIADFLYYDRKEDEELPCGRIQELIASGALDRGQVVAWFAEELTTALDE